MTSTAAPWLDRFLSLDEWDAIDKKDLLGRAELVEGVLAVAPCPIGLHQRIGMRLGNTLDRQRAPELVLTDVEVLVETGRYPTVRRPDAVVLHPGADLGRYRFAPSEVLAVFEILSPGTRGTDRVLKLHEYAQAGIGYYGIVEPGPPVVLTEFGLRGTTFERVGEHTGTARLMLGATVDLDALR